MLVDQRGHRTLVAARLRGVQAGRQLSRPRSTSIPCQSRGRCAKELAARGVDAAQYTTAAWVDDLDAVRAALGYREDQPVGRLVRHACRARVPAPASGSGAQHRARRRRSAVDDREPRHLAVARPRARRASSRRVRGLPACQRRASGSRGDARVDPHQPRTDRSRRRADRSAHRRNATRRLTFDHVIAALQPLTYAPELAGAAARDHRPRRRRATTVRCSRRTFSSPATSPSR